MSFSLSQCLFIDPIALVHAALDLFSFQQVVPSLKSRDLDLLVMLIIQATSMKPKEESFRAQFNSVCPENSDALALLEGKASLSDEEGIDLAKYDLLLKLLRTGE